MKKWITALLMTAIITVMINPVRVLAHATLEETTPKQNAQLKTGPKEISVRFNERVELIGEGLRLFNSEGEQIFKQKAEKSKDQKTLILHLEGITEDTYTLSYGVISDDGHAVIGSYVFSYGSMIKGVHLTFANQAPWIDAVYKTFQILVFSFWYISIGLVYWSLWTKKYQGKLFISSALTFILLFFSQIYQYSGSFDLTSIADTIKNIPSARIWLAMAVMMMVGIYILGKNKFVDITWLILIVFAQSIKGHALTHGIKWVTVPLYVVHISAACIWSGGLAMLIANRKQEGYSKISKTFSNHALISLAILVISGFFQTLIITPNLAEVWQTAWGIMLLIKTVCVLFVIALGSWLRKQIKTGKWSSLKKGVWGDAALMVIIISIASIISMLNPSPPEKPFLWHYKNDQSVFDVKIEGNHYNIRVSAANSAPKTKRVELDVFNKSQPDLGKQNVPLKQIGEDEYESEGVYMTIPGKWNVQLRILDENDDEHVYDNEKVVK